jgi:DNA-directed RNA polymerase specialized sigma24 family protein
MGRSKRRFATTGRPERQASDTGHLPGEPDVLCAALAELTPEQRLVCIWKTVGLSEVEIANRLGCSRGRVADLLSVARAVLRQPGEHPGGDGPA